MNRKKISFRRVIHREVNSRDTGGDIHYKGGVRDEMYERMDTYPRTSGSTRLLKKRSPARRNRWERLYREDARLLLGPVCVYGEDIYNSLSPYKNRHTWGNESLTPHNERKMACAESPYLNTSRWFYVDLSRTPCRILLATFERIYFHML